MKKKSLYNIGYAFIVAVAVPLVVDATANIPASCTTPGDCDAITPRFESLTVKHSMSGEHLYISGSGANPLIVTTADGLVGIGLSDPQTDIGSLEVSYASNTATGAFRSTLTLNDTSPNPSSDIPGHGAGIRFRAMTSFGRTTIAGIWAESETGYIPGKIYFMARDLTNSENPDMTLTSGGNLGIGTTALSTKLEVAGTMSGRHLYISGTGASTILYTTSAGTVSLGTEYGWYSGGITDQLHLVVQGTPAIFNYKQYTAALGEQGLIFASYVAKNGPYQRVSDIVALGVPASPYSGGELRLLTNPTGSGSAVARLIIRENGDIGLGGSLRTDNSFSGATLTALSSGNVGIGTSSPRSALDIPDGKYIQIEDSNAGAPPNGDCDADTERGRISYDSSNNRLYFCAGASRGWDYVDLTN